jgi:DeoR family glycerol-3-phosphate regulon repressor
MEQEPYLSVADLASRYGVSVATVRRDLALVARQRSLTRVRGGVVSPAAIPDESPFGWRYGMQHGEKEAIAAWAAAQVRDGDTLGLDIGTTPLYLARLLRRRQVTVVTNSLKAADLMADGTASVVVTGGTLRPGERSMLGGHALALVRRFHFDLFFMSAGGVSSRGLTDYNVQEVEVKQEFLRLSDRTYALVDSSKFGRRAGLVVAELSRITALVTGALPAPNILEEIRAAGGRVEVAAADPEALPAAQGRAP